jgi:SAM-dependent methyltransferase
MTSHFTVPSDWYQTFFTDPVVRFWDAAIPQPATEAEVAFVIRHIGLSPPARVLDVPCGTGRHALALARAGFTVTGFDLSEPALDRARARAEVDGLAAQFVHANMLELDIDAPGDALICMGNSIGYFEPDLTQRLLRKFASALHVGCRLILDTSICAESLQPIPPSRTITFAGGSYEREIEYDAVESVIKTRALLTIDGEKHELLYRHFLMTSGELVRALRSARFEVVGLYGDTLDAAFVPGSSRLLLVAMRT